MRWSFPIGRVFGITLRLHVTFLLLLAIIGYQTFVEGGLRSSVWALSLVCSVFACVVLHELGHSVVAQQLGVQVRSITLLPIGGVAALKRIPENPWHEIAITLAGPMVNAAIAAVLIPVTGLPQHLLLLPMPHDMTGLLYAIMAANVSLFLFNFIPAFPMDGGRLLRAVLALGLPYQRATAIAATVGQGLAIVFVLIGLRDPAWWILVIIGVFIFIGAEGEEKMVRARSLLREIDVEEVMTREFATLQPFDAVSRGLEMVYQTGQDDFPVMDDGHLVGLVSRRVLVEAVNKQGAHVPIAQVMDTQFPVVPPHARVSQVFEDMISEGHSSFPVMDNGHLIGLLSPDNISRYLLVQSSIKSSRWKKPIPTIAGARRPMPHHAIPTAPPVATPRPPPIPSQPPGPA